MRLSKTVLGLAAGAIALIALAVVFVVQSGLFAERALPLLASQRDKVARITIQHDSQTLTLRKGGDGTWLVETAGEAPVREGLAEALLDDLAGMTLVQKAAGPAGSSLDGSGDFAIALADEAGVALALFALRPGEGLPEGQALVVPEGGAPVVAGRVPEINLSPEHWADVFIPRLEAKRVRVVRVMTPDARMTTYERAAPDAPFQRVAGDAGAPVDGESIRRALEAVEGLAYDQVRQAGELAWTGATMLMAETFDGVALTLLGASGEDGMWVRVNAHYQAPGEGAPDAAANAEAERFNRMRAFAFRLPPETADKLKGLLRS